MKKIMKSRIILLTVLAVMLFTFTSVFAAEPTDRDAYRGIWGCYRASMRIIREDADFHVIISWGSSAFETSVWVYRCSYDEGRGELVADGSGSLRNLIFGDEDAPETVDVKYTDGSARFAINEAGMLTWNDLKEDAGNGMEFEKSDPSWLLPTPEELADSYFKMIGSGWQTGTAGSSLRQALTVYNTFKFASDHELWALDINVLRDNLLTSWEALPEEERNAFDTRFIDLIRLADSCLSDWEGNRGIFQDAGVGDAMEQLLKDAAAVESWRTLFSNTLTMGNSDS